MKLTNRIIQAEISGRTQKVCWSMIWQRKEITVLDVVKKGYEKASITSALKVFVERGYVEKVENLKNTYIVSDSVGK